MPLPTPPASQRSIFTPVHGRNAHLFQPPKSPASIATTPSHANTSADYFSNGASRKRSRPDSSNRDHPQSDKWNAPMNWTATTPQEDDVFGSGPNSMVNEQYKLAGGYDTPGLAVNTDLDCVIDHDAQARRWTRDRDATYGHSGPSLQGPLARERNGTPRMLDPTEGQSHVSWTRFAFSLVGKAFTFGTSVFKGFYAGGGDGYDFNEKHGYDGAAGHQRGPPTPVPGQWQADDFFGDFEQDNPVSPPSSGLRPPNKRRQTDKDEWVLIGTPDARGPSPKRKTSANYVPQVTKAPALPPRLSASRASPRRSLLPTPIRRQPSYVSQVESRATLTVGPERRASVANVRSPTSRPGSSVGHRKSPSSGSDLVSPEAERYRKRQAKQDRVADKAIGNMSRQLEELIRQGQAALGTKFSVEGDVDEDMDDVYTKRRW
jgi:hypothetical protein